LNLKPLVLNFSLGNWSLGGFGDVSADLSDDNESESKPWPECVRRNVIVHGYTLGEALMVDLTSFGAKSGCWNGDCKRTDKFHCPTMDRCAEVCQQVDACKWWTHGMEDFAPKCWLRGDNHRKEKRYGFSSGLHFCAPATSSSSSSSSAPDSQAALAPTPDALAAATGETSMPPVAGLAGSAVPSGQDGSQPSESAPVPRRLMSFEDDYGMTGGRPYSLSFGQPYHYPVFGMDTKEQEARREQKDESCRIHGYFDTNKVPGNFHIGTHGATVPSYLNFYDQPAPQSQNMRHTIGSLAFVDVDSGAVLNQSQPLDDFESPKAFTFQYYISITPATERQSDGQERHGYKFRAGSFVTNELIGPAVFFRFDIDPIRVTYYEDGERTLSGLIVNLCAVVGGVIAACAMASQFLEGAGEVLFGGGS